MKKIVCVLFVSLALILSGSTAFASGGSPPPPTCTDADGDGYSIEGGECGLIDCNDNNATTYPAAPEICGDGIDNNCSGVIDEGCKVAAEWLDITPGLTANKLNGVWVSPGGNPVAVGNGGVIVRSDDGGETFYTQSSGVTDRNLRAVYGFDENQIYAVGNWHRQTFYYDGNSWSKFYEMLGATQDYALEGIWGTGHNYMVAVGENNQKWFFYEFNYNVYTYNNGSADAHDTGIAAKLWAIDGNASNDWYAVGDANGGCNVYRFTGSYFLNKINTGTTASLQGVWVSPEGHVFAVGDSGTIVQNTGSGWSVTTNVTTQDLKDVWGSDSSNVYAVGNNGTILHYDGSAWAVMACPVAASLKSIDGIDEETIFAVGTDGTILKLGIKKEQQYTMWCDPETNLCWQDPQREAYNYGDVGLRTKEAVEYCEELVLGGFDDWRVPLISELRSIIAGNPDTEAGGACPINDGTLNFLDSWDPACMGGEYGAGPGVDGCYLDPNLTGTCNKIDKYSAGHYLEGIALESAADDERWIATVMFELGGVLYNHLCTVGDVRCVRDDTGVPATTCVEPATCEPGVSRECTVNGHTGAQFCNDAGNCWGPCEYTTHVPEITNEFGCHNLVCDQSDGLNLTINVPEELPYAPHKLIALYYDANTWEFPPSRPPDGGTWTNQIVDPGMPPYNMVVPACKYYGEFSLEGDYYLYVHLQMDYSFPPIPLNGDYWWGEGESYFSFPVDNDPSVQTLIDTSISLKRVGGCPPETPVECGSGQCLPAGEVCCPGVLYKCPDGECVDGPSDCLSCGACEPDCPDDSEVWSCRYSSSFTSENCADFPPSEGWVNMTAQDIYNVCAAQQGADASSIVVTQGDTCRYERCVFSTCGTCEFTYDGKKFIATGIPSIGCTFGGGSNYTEGNVCYDY